MPRSLPRIVVAVAAVCAALAATGSAASAAVSINGNPMTVYVGPQGQLQARVSGSADGITTRRSATKATRGSSSPSPREDRSGALTARPARTDSNSTCRSRRNR